MSIHRVPFYSSKSDFKVICFSKFLLIADMVSISISCSLQSYYNLLFMLLISKVVRYHLYLSFLLN